MIHKAQSCRYRRHIDLFQHTKKKIFYLELLKLARLKDQNIDHQNINAFIYNFILVSF